MESKARNMEQSSLLERLQQLLHQSLQSNLAQTVSPACFTSSNHTWLQGFRQPPGSAVCHKAASMIAHLNTLLGCVRDVTDDRESRVPSIVPRV